LVVVASLVQCCAIYKKLLLHHSYMMLPVYSSQYSRLSSRVANLTFLKPDFEILAFIHLSLSQMS